MLKKCLLTIAAVLAASFAIVAIAGQFSTEEETNRYSKVNEGKGNRDETKNLLGVEYTLSPEYVGDVTQEELSKAGKKEGFISVELHEDGSATYSMTRGKYREVLCEEVDKMEDDLDAMVGSENYPSFTKIKANSDFTEYTIETTSNEVDYDESALLETLTYYSNLYGCFIGVEVENIHVDFVDATSEEVIRTIDTKELVTE